MMKTLEAREALRRGLIVSLLLILILILPCPVGAERQPAAGEDPSADPTAGLSRKDARIRDLAFYRNDDQLYADFRLTGAFIGEVRERMDSGLETTFRFTVEVLRKRNWLFDLRLGRRTVLNRVKRDTMAGRYTLIREVDGIEVARTSTEDPAVVRDWMSRVERVGLVGVGQVPGVEADIDPRLTVRVRAKVKDDYILLFIPWDFETDWEKVVLPLSEIPVLAAPAGAGEADGGG